MKHIMYCKDCKYLSITEEQQEITNSKEEHICSKFNKRVVHGLHHPDILRCIECMKGEFDND